MRTYGQFCGLARALDQVGDKWTLLIVRELLVGPRGYGELRAGLPGVATNLLADRLRRLEDDGLVAREDERYALTARGEELEDVVSSFIRWSTPLMVAGRGTDEFRSHWLVPALRALLGGRRGRPGALELCVDGHALHLRATTSDVAVADGPAGGPATTITADAGRVLAVAAGMLPFDVLVDGVAGDPDVARAVLVRR